MAPPIEDIRVSDSIKDFLQERLGKKKYRRLRAVSDRAILKTAPLGENTGTKIIYRWDLLDRHPNRDELYASEEQCRAIRKELIAKLIFCDDIETIDNSVKEEARDYIDGEFEEPLKCPRTGEKILLSEIKEALGQTSVLGRDESPIGFANPPQESEGVFERGNITWLKPPTHLYELRDYFDDIGDKIVEKIQRKTYKTDRRLTGVYKTNREHRWESHPDDPQSASRFECWEIEVKLFAQMFKFDSAPKTPDSIKKSLEEYVEGELSSGTFLAPITGEPIDYETFIEHILDATHGESGYHIGHLEPLAYEGGDGRHEMENISWITELGNRVQGSNSFSKIVEQIFNMACYHKERLNLDWEELDGWTAEKRKKS
ncbi:MAG: hypothetical protein ABEJ98_05840 [Candidatus Nanohaloarchaea archaeon]